MEERTFLEDDFQFANTRHDIMLQDEVLPQKPFWKDILHRFCENKGAVVRCIFILIIIVLAIIVPMVSLWGFDDINTAMANRTPNGENWFGTISILRKSIRKIFCG